MKKLNIFTFVALMLVLLTIQHTEGKKMTIDEVKKTIKNLRKPCQKKTDVTKELLDGQHRGEFPKDERLMCYIKCIMTSTKTMKNDQIVWDFFLMNARLLLIDEYIPRVEHAVEVCQKQVTATEGCEVAWQAGKCLWDTDTIFGPVMDWQFHQRSKRNFHSIRHRYLRQRSRRKADMAVCKNSRTKPQCRRV